MKLASYKPRGYWILIDPILEDTRTKGGIYLQASEVGQKTNFVGRVIRSGDIASKEGITEGDTVVLEHTNGIHEIYFEDQPKPLYSVNIHNILGIAYNDRIRTSSSD